MAAHRTFGAPRIVAVGLILASGVGVEGRADRIVLRGGVEIKGVVVPGAGRPDQVAVLTEVMDHPSLYSKNLVVEVVPEPTPLTAYLARRGRTATTAEAQYELGLWCEQHRLTSLASLHYRRAIEQDPAYGPAHKKLGHVEYAGRWVTRDEVRVAQGLVKYKGKWVSGEKKERIDAEATATSERLSWSRRLATIRRKILNGNAAQRQEAAGQLAAIRDPAAVVPLVRTFARDPDGMRIVLAQTLGAIPGRDAALALVGRLLAEEEDEVREAMMREIAGREEPSVIPQLAQALRADDPRVINRAAWALGNLEAVAAVPNLIPALIFVQQRVEMDQGVSLPASDPSGFGVGGLGTGAGISFGGGSFSSGTTLPLPYLTPAVGPGVAAYGASAYPYGAPVGTELGSIPVTPRAPQEQIVTEVFRNAEVLASLRKLTGQDFGFEIDSWRRWLSTSFRPPKGPLRRVPQP